MEDTAIYLPEVYYIGHKGNTVEFRIQPIKFAPLVRVIDGEITETHKPLEDTYYRIDHLQGRLLGNTWSLGDVFFSTVEKAKENIKEDKSLVLMPEFQRKAKIEKILKDLA